MESTAAAAGKPQCHRVAGDRGGRRSCSSPCTRAARRGPGGRTASRASPGAAWTEPEAWAASFLRPGTSRTQGAAGARRPGPTSTPQAHGARPPSGRSYHTCPPPRLPPAAGEWGRGGRVRAIQERLGGAGAEAEAEASLAAPSKQRSLFSMVRAQPSNRTPLPVPFKGLTLCGAAQATKV